MTRLSSSPHRAGAPATLAPARRLWPLFIPLLLLLLAWLGRLAGPGVAGVVQAARPLPMPDLVECSSNTPQMIVPIFDVSGSVIDRGGADPKARSFSEFRAVIDALAAKPCSADDRVAALIFASRAVEAPPTLLSSASVAKTVIRRPPSHEIGRGTNMTGAFERARDLEVRFADYDVVFVVFSDNDAHSLTSAAAAADDIRAPIHGIGLGAVQPGLADHMTTFEHLDDLDRGDLATRLIQIVNEQRSSASSVSHSIPESQ